MTDTSGVDPQSIIAQAKARAQAAGSTAAPKGDRLVPSQTDPLAALKAHTQPGPSLIDRANSAMGTPFDAASLKASNPWADILHGLGRAMTLAPMGMGARGGMDAVAPLDQGVLQQGQQAVEGALTPQGGAPPPDVQQALDALKPASGAASRTGASPSFSEIINSLTAKGYTRQQIKDMGYEQARMLGGTPSAPAGGSPASQFQNIKGPADWRSEITPADRAEADNLLQREAAARNQGNPQAGQADQVGQQAVARAVQAPGWVRPAAPGTPAIEPPPAPPQPPAPVQAQVPPMPQGQPPPVAQPALPAPGQGAPVAPAGGGVPPGVLMAIELALHGHPAMAGAAWMLRRYAANNPGVVPQIAARLGGTPARLAGLKRLLGF